MSSPIGPGDWLEAVRDTRSVDDGSELVAGRAYRCVDVNDSGDDPCDQCGDNIAPTLDIEGQVSPDFGWCVCNFRKIDRISDEFRKALLTPVPLDLEPVEEAQRSEPAEPVPTHGTKARSLSQLQQKEA